MPPRKLEPIAIIGTGCRFPGGANSPSKLWDLLREPRDLAKRIPHDRFNIDAFYHPDGSHFGTTDVKESYFLEEDPRRFDSQFFNIQPAEAKALDPQQRLLLETVFEAIESAGVELDSLKGSNTAVYVGLMCDDYSEIVRRDLNTLPTYAVTGTSRAIMSNRISYFFDWRGPSMTIDTACSSSMVAIHQAVQALRNNESRTAVAAGANLIFGPEAYISESNLHMLSSSGRSRMWDAAADGYARGEATGALVLKRLCDAIKDGDHVECIIRETGVNQDGRTQGITMPSETSQAALIRDTYLRAGLDLTKRNDRCQYFEAHGTGTAVGDPKEAEAVATAFFGHEDNVLPDDVLFVGSIKTVVGHTEGTAGIAGVIKASLALQHGVIPQNLHFNQLNPAIEPFYKHLQVPTAATPWPSVPQGQPRRASVNSFGLGGTNAHAILESFEPLGSNLCSKERPEVESFPAVLPFVFSAASEHSLVATIQNFSNYIKTNKSLHLGNLAFTLSQRSVFPFRAAFSALTGPDLVSKMDTKLALFDENPSISCAIRSPTSPCEILGVFTGQGAQWATMGRGLLRSSEPFRRTIVELEASLARLPEKDRPTWSLEEEIMLEASSSRISEAALSQPLCTAIQIALVNLLRIAGIRFGAVVGHSSGEIAAAYAAGFISAYDSIRIAYYRGLLAKHACGPNGKRGAMIAIGVTYQEATELCSSPHFEGRVKLAASNSSSSITLSGDIDAIEEIKVSFDEEKKFARILKIDTAYHSHHMLKCSDMYMQALRACNIQVQTPPADACSWYSSVYGGMKMVSNHLLKDTYWRENMVGSVLFSQAVQCAIQTNDSLSMTLEVGPHPALKAPVQHTFQEISGSESFYTSTLSRGLNDTEVFAEMLGFVWSHLKPSAVNLSAYGKSIRDDNGALMLMKGLPSYEWDHERVFWNESRCSMLLRTRGDPRHELLGSRLPESIDGEIRWVNFLSPNEIPFVNGHIVQGQKVFPGAGYITMAIEAAMIMVRGQSIKMLEIEDLKILRALGFDDDTTGIETMFTLSSITSRNGAEEVITANFACYSCLNKQAGNMVMMASGTVQAVLGACSDILLPDRLPEDETLTPVHGEPLYTSLAELGYQYSGDFKSLSSMRRKMNNAVGLITNPLDGGSTSSLLVHPAVLDAMFQTMFVAYSSPYDGRLWSLHLPTGVRRITIDPTRCGSDMGSKLLFDAESAGSDPNALSGDVDIFTEDGTTPIMKMEGMAFKPFSEATAADDSELFSEAVWGVASPDGSALMAEVQATEEEMELGQLCERVAYFYYRKLLETVSIAERDKLNLPFHHRSLFNAASEIISQVSEGRHPFARVEWNLDSKKALLEIMSKYPHSADFNIMRAVGENLPGVVRGETTILEHMTKDGLLDDYYKHGLGFNPSHELISRMVAQIAHRYPRMNILEIGAGTGGSTKKILPRLDRAFSSYTFTDISTGFFEKAQDIFKDYSSRMIFKKLDIEADTVAQGFEDHSYDLVICANVLHATKNLEQTMVNVRRLLKPGGHLVLLEVINNGPMRIGFVMSGLPGWWIGADDGRTLCPTISLDKWDSLLKNTGFSGVDSATPTNDPLPHPASVFATQAVDERITHIRQPLNSGGVETSIDNLLILGGNTPQTTRLAEDLTWSLRKYCKHVIRIKGLDELHDTDMSPMTTVISLTELDEPIFKTMTEEKWEALKLLFDLSRNVLWVTQGCLENEPYSNMTVGLCRSVCYELPHLQIQLLDVESAEMPKADLLSEMLLRLQMKDYWEKKEQLHGIVWSTEPEYVLQEGKLHILRMMPSKHRNNRYNSSRRLITKEADTQSVIRLENKEGAYFLTESCKILPPVLFNSSPALAMHRIDVSYSLISPIRLALQANLFLCLGSTKINGVQTNVIFLSDATTSVVNVPECYTIPCSPLAGQEVHLLLAANSHLLSLGILGNVPSGSAVVLNNPEPYLAHALKVQAAKKGICLTLIASDGCERGLPWVSIHRRSSKRMIKLALPKGPSILIDFAGTYSAREIGSRIRECLPKLCQEIMPEFYLGDQASFPEFLEDAVAFSRSALANPGNISTTSQLIPLKEVADFPNLPQLTTVIDWALPTSVPVKIQPADSANLFSQNKTYLLAGLTRDLGQSLCQWMLTKGAKYIVIASRNPLINPTWLKGLASRGAIVKVMSMDITDRHSVLKVNDDICKTMPPVGGVANGAMVLRDTSFPRMSYDELQTVLRPKVEGTQYLDEIFSTNTLDFFILFSSLVAVLGNSGQSNYSAANMYMTSLAAQRRKRGLAASVMNISGIFGIGYVSRVDDVTHKQLSKIKFKPMSEQDLHQMFAEAVLGGTPDSGANPEFTAGLQQMSADNDTTWSTNPKFSHFVRTPEEVTTKRDNRESVASLNNQLLLVATKEEAIFLIKASLSTRIQRSLLLDDDPEVEIPLIDLGVDSLVAVEVRSWFMKELNVDMPVLKVLGGASISDLAAMAVEKLQLEYAPNMGTPEGVGRKPALIHNTPSTPSTRSDGSRGGRSNSSSISRPTTGASTPNLSEKGQAPNFD